MSELLPSLSTLGYVNKPTVGIGMHIVGLHSAEKKGNKATTCIYSTCFDISEIQTSLSPVIVLHVNSAGFNRSTVHMYHGLRRKKMHGGMLLTFYP